MILAFSANANATAKTEIVFGEEGGGGGGVVKTPGGKKTITHSQPLFLFALFLFFTSRVAMDAQIVAKSLVRLGWAAQ